MKKKIKANTRPNDRYGLYGESTATTRLLDMISDDVISAEGCLIELIKWLPKDTVDEFARDYLDLFDSDEDYE